MINFFGNCRRFGSMAGVLQDLGLILLVIVGDF
jgi:hypothetical protein